MGRVSAIMVLSTLCGGRHRPVSLLALPIILGLLVLGAIVRPTTGLSHYYNCGTTKNAAASQLSTTSFQAASTIMLAGAGRGPIGPSSRVVLRRRADRAGPVARIEPAVPARGGHAPGRRLRRRGSSSVAALPSDYREAFIATFRPSRVASPADRSRCCFGPRTARYRGDLRGHSTVGDGAEGDAALLLNLATEITAVLERGVMEANLRRARREAEIQWTSVSTEDSTGDVETAPVTSMLQSRVEIWDGGESAGIQQQWWRLLQLFRSAAPRRTAALGDALVVEMPALQRVPIRHRLLTAAGYLLPVPASWWAKPLASFATSSLWRKPPGVPPLGRRNAANTSVDEELPAPSTAIGVGAVWAVASRVREFVARFLVPAPATWWVTPVASVAMSGVRGGSRVLGGRRGRRATGSISVKVAAAFASIRLATVAMAARLRQKCVARATLRVPAPGRWWAKPVASFADAAWRRLGRLAWRGRQPATGRGPSGGCAASFSAAAVVTEAPAPRAASSSIPARVRRLGKLLARVLLPAPASWWAEPLASSALAWWRRAVVARALVDDVKARDRSTGRNVAIVDPAVARRRVALGEERDALEESRPARSGEQLRKLLGLGNLEDRAAEAAVAESRLTRRRSRLGIRGRLADQDAAARRTSLTNDVQKLREAAASRGSTFWIRKYARTILHWRGDVVAPGGANASSPAGSRQGHGLPQRYQSLTAAAGQRFRLSKLRLSEFWAGLKPSNAGHGAKAASLRMQARMRKGLRTEATSSNTDQDGASQPT